MNSERHSTKGGNVKAGDDSLTLEAQRFLVRVNVKVMSAKLLNRYKLRIRETGRYSTTQADDRENVKLGTILIELSGDESDLLALELLATHDEFTYTRWFLLHTSSRTQNKHYDTSPNTFMDGPDSCG